MKTIEKTDLVPMDAPAMEHAAALLAAYQAALIAKVRASCIMPCQCSQAGGYTLRGGWLIV